MQILSNPLDNEMFAQKGVNVRADTSDLAAGAAYKQAANLIETLPA